MKKPIKKVFTRSLSAVLLSISLFAPSVSASKNINLATPTPTPKHSCSYKIDWDSSWAIGPSHSTHEVTCSHSSHGGGSVKIVCSKTRYAYHYVYRCTYSGCTNSYTKGDDKTGHSHPHC